jgi:hypothetical protein
MEEEVRWLVLMLDSLKEGEMEVEKERVIVIEIVVVLEEKIGKNRVQWLVRVGSDLIFGRVVVRWQLWPNALESRTKTSLLMKRKTAEDQQVGLW